MVMMNYVTTTSEKDLIIKILRVAKFMAVEFHISELSKQLDKILTGTQGRSATLLDAETAGEEVSYNGRNPAECEDCD
jgi:hypothetical protein